MKQDIKLYTCPMHPNVWQETEGLCPECGMNLVKKRQDARYKVQTEKGFNKHQGHKTNVFKVKFWVSLVLSIPVVAYSNIVQQLLDWQAPVFPGSQFIPLVLSSIIFFYGGWVFIASAYRELRGRRPGMMTLISLAILTAYIYSVGVTFIGGDKTLFWELATLITVMLLGHWLETRAVAGAQGALKELSQLIPDKAELIIDNKSEIPIPPSEIGAEKFDEGLINSKLRIQDSKLETKAVSVSKLKVGDLVLVRPGSRIPADGEVVAGSSEVNESIITGESKPVLKQAGDSVIAGTINGDGSLKVKVTKIGEKTFLAGVMRLVQEAQTSKSKLQLLSDRAAYYLTLIAIVSGGIALAAWLALANPAFAIERMVAVLVIACPHALGLAIPLVASISTTKAAQNGFLVKQRLALEAARRLDTVLFDKTGTLTQGNFGVTDIISAQPIPDVKLQITDKAEISNSKFKIEQLQVLQLAASVNSHSEHPIAQAMVKEAKQQGLELLPINDFQRIAGQGVSGQLSINGQYSKILIGSRQLLEDNNIAIEQYSDEITSWEKQGKTVVHIVAGNDYLGSIALADIIRQESREAIAALHQLGIKTAMVTGDSSEVAEWVARELGIDEYYARVMPGDKAEIVKKLQNPKPAQKNSVKGEQIQNSRFKIQNSSQRQAVAFVGDGVNDAPALTQANLGIAIGAGTNVAIESADIILVKNDPRDIVKIISLSKLTYSKMIQNLFWAAGYNIIALPLAGGVLAFKGIFLQPALAALLMSLSTVIVAINAVLLKRRVL